MLISYLLSVVLFGALGGWLAQKAQLPLIAGVLIGAIANALGCTFLAGVWLAEWVVERFGKA